MGYATSQNPLGPFTKAANNPVLQKDTEQGGIVTGTGHCMLIDIHDRLYCVYHGRTETTGDERMVFIDLIDIQPDGETGGLRTEYGFTENHILKAISADCTAFHGSLFPVALLYIPRLMKIKKDISIHNNPLHICS